MSAKKIGNTKVIVDEGIQDKGRHEKVGGSSVQQEIVNQLMQSNLELQHKTVDLLHGVKGLTERMDNMVKIFEEAAAQMKSGSEEPLMKRLEELLEQNKTIAKGLILLEKYVREKASYSMPGFQRGVTPPEPF